MNGEVVLSALVRGLHDVFAAAWAGGLLTMALVVVQTMKVARAGLQDRVEPDGNPREGGPERFMLLLQQRLRKVVTVAIVGVFVTGVWLLRASLQSSGGVERSLYTTLLAVKVALSLIMVVIAIIRSAKLRRLDHGSGDLRASGFPLLFTNAAIAVVVLMLSGAAGVVQ